MCLFVLLFADRLCAGERDSGPWRQSAGGEAGQHRKQTVEKFGRLDIAFNNAGQLKFAPLTEFKVEDFESMMKVNVTGVFLGMKHQVLAMKANKPQQGGSSLTTARSSAK